MKKTTTEIYFLCLLFVRKQQSWNVFHQGLVEKTNEISCQLRKTFEAY